MTRDLRDDCCNFRVKRERGIFYEVAAHAPKIYGRKEILKVDIENEISVPVLPCIRDYRTTALETVCNLVSSSRGMN